jgi:hypothetical protein
MFLDHSYFKKGYFNLSVAVFLGVIMVGHIVSDHRWGWALIDLVLGLGNLYFYLEQRKRNS